MNSDDLERAFYRDWEAGKVKRVFDGKRMVPEREWINLTVQEREKLRDEYGDNPSGLISAVQMMLKEKNGN